MSSKEKANRLIEKYLIEFLDDSGCGWTEKCASICAKICVQEIINSNPHSNPLNTQVESTMGYWQEVLNHLNEI